MFYLDDEKPCIIISVFVVYNTKFDFSTFFMKETAIISVIKRFYKVNLLFNVIYYIENKVSI